MSNIGVNFAKGTVIISAALVLTVPALQARAMVSEHSVKSTTISTQSTVVSSLNVRWDYKNKCHYVTSGTYTGYQLKPDGIMVWFDTKDGKRVIKVMALFGPGKVVSTAPGEVKLKSVTIKPGANTSGRCDDLNGKDRGVLKFNGAARA